MDLQLRDKVAVVTGASRGIGLGAALRLAQEGVRLLLCARTPESLAAAATLIGNRFGTTVKTCSADLATPEGADILRDAVLLHYGGADVLVNNAGTGIYKPFLEVTEQDLSSGMALNFFAQFRVSQRLVPAMIERGGGVIVNVAGCSGLQVMEPPFYSTCTGPAKAAEIRFSKALAAELGPRNIRVNCVAPNFVDVPERAGRWTADMNPRGLPVDELKRLWADRVALPGKRWCTIEEVANAIAFLASPACGYITGEVMVIDGGYRRD